MIRRWLCSRRHANPRERIVKNGGGAWLPVRSNRVVNVLLVNVDRAELNANGLGCLACGANEDQQVQVVLAPTRAVMESTLSAALSGRKA